jgi:hypothetical protein
LIFFFFFWGTAAMVAFCGSESAAGENPLTCKVDSPKIECSVNVDNVSVTNVILNRGNCSGPIATPQQIRSLKDFAEQLPPDVRERTRNNPDLMDSLVFERAKRDPSFAGRGNDIRKALADPRGNYKFGDIFKFWNTCPNNLIEYTIEANGIRWTFKARPEF